VSPDPPLPSELFAYPRGVRLKGAKHSCTGIFFLSPKLCLS
jgi:hypothetical protein